MANLIPSFENTQIMSWASSSGAVDDNVEDACSICLETFNTDDPATITRCKHEYHLQCILEWSQRSKECPICSQLLVLNDPPSQELLAAVESERSLRARRNARIVYEDYDTGLDASDTDDSDVDERIMQHFTAARYGCRRGTQRPFGFNPSLMYTSSPYDCQFSDSGLFEDDSPSSRTPFTRNDQNQSHVVPSIVNMVDSTSRNNDGPTNPRGHCGQLPPNSPPKPSSTKFLAFSESFKSKFSTASVSRYKESISKSTRGFKEKLLARNVSVKELGRGVQREMSAGISGVARMIERIDLKSNLPDKGKGVKESVITESLNRNAGENINDMTNVYNTISRRLEVTLAQDEK